MVVVRGKAGEKLNHLIQNLPPGYKVREVVYQEWRVTLVRDRENNLKGAGVRRVRRRARTRPSPKKK